MTYLASILSDKFVNAFVATCTSQQLALEMQFYLDFHQVYTTMTANADQRKWRQIRIFADKRKWRKIRISTEQRKWRKIRISAVSVHILRIQQYRTIRATRGSCSYREGIIFAYFVAATFSLAPPNVNTFSLSSQGEGSCCGQAFLEFRGRKESHEKQRSQTGLRFPAERRSIRAQWNFVTTWLSPWTPAVRLQRTETNSQ